MKEPIIKTNGMAERQRVSNRIHGLVGNCRCGAKGELSQVGRLIPKKRFEVVCSDISCGRESGYWSTKKLVIERWNKMQSIV